MPTSNGSSPQAKGRELARLGRTLWQESGSVRDAAAALMSSHPEITSLQAHRYACGLSQSQAAERYNSTTDHQTTLGNTTINSWESWARRAGGSPPSFSSLLVLAEAYGQGPLGASQEELSPSDLVADCYERLLPEDQLTLRRHATTKHAPAGLPQGVATPNGSTGSGAVLRLVPGNVVGQDFALEVPTVQFGNPLIRVFSLPNPRPGTLLNLTWETFGLGIERLIQQIKNLGARLDVDACFGINEAGLVMATFLASAQFDRCPVGYLKCQKSRDSVWLDDASFYPLTKDDAPTIVLCDFEVKHADVIGFITAKIRERYPRADIYFAVFGAMTKGLNLEVASFDDLTGAGIMRKADFAAVFIAATMSPPGIEPPLELR